jgi:hypothetical protein
VGTSGLFSIEPATPCFKQLRQTLCMREDFTILNTSKSYSTTSFRSDINQVKMVSQSIPESVQYVELGLYKNAAATRIKVKTALTPDTSPANQHPSTQLQAEFQFGTNSL